jgi:hypothetical protein
MLGPTCVEIQSVEILTVFDGLCCVGFINPTGVVAGVCCTEPGLKEALYIL